MLAARSTCTPSACIAARGLSGSLVYTSTRTLPRTSRRSAASSFVTVSPDTWTVRNVCPVSCCSPCAPPQTSSKAQITANALQRIRVSVSIRAYESYPNPREIIAYQRPCRQKRCDASDMHPCPQVGCVQRVTWVSSERQIWLQCIGTHMYPQTSVHDEACGAEARLRQVCSAAGYQAF